MKKWFSRFPYPGWIILFFIFLISFLTVYHFDKQTYSPESLSTLVQKDFSRREAILYVDALTGFFTRNDQDSSTDDNSDHYYYFIIRNGKPVNWNTNKITLTDSLMACVDSLNAGKIVRLNHVTYFLRAWKMKERDSNAASVLTFIPIAYNYSFENKYFKSHFIAGDKIPPSTTISNSHKPGSFVIKNSNHKPAFYLKFQENTLHLFVADFWVWLLGIFTLLSFFVLVHKICLLVSMKTRAIYGWILLFLIIILIAVCRIIYGLPEGFDNSTFFSPKLLASGNIVHSFGDLVFLTLFDTWMIVYVLKYIPVNNVINFKNKGLNTLLHIVNICFLIAILFFIQAERIYKLVIDSKISFEAGDFSKLSLYTFLAIAVLIIITINFLFILRIINGALKSFLKRDVFRYLIVAALGLICIYLLRDRAILFFYFTILFMCLAGLFLLDRLGLPVNLFSENKDVSNASHTYVWFIILCSWITIELFYFNYYKEKELRKVFATKQEQRDDALVSFLFENMASDLQQDQLIKAYWRDPSPTLRSKINRSIIFRYLGDQFNKYKISVYYFNRYRDPLTRADTSGRNMLNYADQLFGKAMRQGIVYLNDPENKNIYWGILPVLNNNLSDTLGFLGFDFAMEKHPQTDYITSLLQQNYNPADQQYFDKYAYAIYRKHKLWTQGGNQAFPFFSDYATDGQEYKFKESLFNSILYYKPDRHELIQVVYQRNLLISIISLFSYVLAILLVMSGLLFVFSYFIVHPLKGKVWRERKLFNLTIRSKVNLTILITVFLSLLVVGVITVSFLKNRYKEDQQRSLKNLMFYFSQNIINFIETNKINLSQYEPDSSGVYSELNYRLSVLASEQAVDINLYGTEGRLAATSQSEMLQKGFLSNFMDRSVLLALRSGRNSDLVVQETIGSLDYQSLYLPLRNKKDEIIAYLNLPYYASRPELKEEISNILATLVNIYTLIFFISGISAILISNSIIKSFHLLIRQFRAIRLQHNVLINWPYRDELGLLVKEYNEMIIKVEDMATKLASNAREAAWRELALQVAHEIKNPLTPMKLNIQYLQNAIKSGRSDIPELTARLTSGLIDQIESLNVIASEFAHFAKMPEAQPEVLKVHEMLLSITALFQEEKHAEVSLTVPDQHLQIIMDKGYFMRIFTNLVKNAVQAIPENVSGKIEVSYRKMDKKVIILVKDNGPGIPPELQKKMFVPYFTTKTSGTGIGLSMSKNMVEHSNGKIWFETEAGVGTTFFVQFPLA